MGYYWIRIPELAAARGEQGGPAFLVLNPDGELLGITRWPVSEGRIEKGMLLGIGSDAGSGGMVPIVYRLQSSIAGFDYPISGTPADLPIVTTIDTIKVEYTGQADLTDNGIPEKVIVRAIGTAWDALLVRLEIRNDAEDLLFADEWSSDDWCGGLRRSRLHIPSTLGCSIWYCMA